MMEKRIKAIDTLDLDFEDIRTEIRDNLEISFRETIAKRQKKLPYMRAVRAVCYTLCVCMAAGALTFIIKGTNFWNMVTPPTQIPGTLGEDTGETETPPIIIPPDIFQPDITPPDNFNNDAPMLTDPGKYDKLARQFDKFFAFGTLIHPKLILKSELLNENDRNIFSEHVEKSENEYYIVYMGINQDVDSVVIFDWASSEKFEFVSNLDYRYEEIISKFEQESGVKLTDDYLCDNRSKKGIELSFKRSGERYIPFYEAVIDNKAYVIDLEKSLFIDNSDTAGIVNIPNYLVAYGVTRKMNEANASYFDTFLAFTTVQMGDVYRLGLLSDADWSIFEPYNYGEYDVYLGTKDGVDYVILTSSLPKKTFIFKSNLNYKFEDVITEFERLSGCELTNKFLTTSVYDKYLRRETGGISLCLKRENGDAFSGEMPYFRAEIDGKIYVINK